MQLPDSSDKRVREIHGLHKTRTYKVWAGMHGRCKYPSATGYDNYGGKGVTVCNRWGSFVLFLADMGEAPAGMSIERNDGAGNYEPSNCRWASRVEQLRNRSNNVVLEHAGRRQCIAAWAEEASLPYRLVYARIGRGWTLTEATATPARAHKPYQAKVAV